MNNQQELEKIVKKKSSVQDFADNLKGNPKKIITWCRREILEYQELIKILEQQIKK